MSAQLIKVNLMSNQQNNQIIEVVALALRRSVDGKILLARRGPDCKGAGEWEFPGGKIEFSETPQSALIREISEELSFDLSLLPLTFIAENTHAYPTRTVKISLWLAQVDDTPSFKLSDHDKVEWCLPQEMSEFNLSEGDKAFVSLLNF